jgi:WD40 repeat protein
VIGVCVADGRFEYWHVPSMKKLFSIKEEENSILCCDFDPTGERFATAGKDRSIRVYDESTVVVNVGTKSVCAFLGCADWNYSGHSNRIFSLKFMDSNTVVSGGWDSVIHIWDLRQLRSVRSFYGPHLAGDSLDFQENTLLTGCYATKNQSKIRNTQMA